MMAKIAPLVFNAEAYAVNMEKYKQVPYALTSLQGKKMENAQT